MHDGVRGILSFDQPWFDACSLLHLPGRRPRKGNLRQRLDINLGVNTGGVDGTVSQQVRNLFQRRASLEPTASNTMADHMRAANATRQSCFGSHAQHDPANADWRYRFASRRAVLYEQRRR